jgi:hypothetical protein
LLSASDGISCGTHPQLMHFVRQKSIANYEFQITIVENEPISTFSRSFYDS